MTLSQEDGRLFFQLFIPLLGFVNEKYKIRKYLYHSAKPLRADYDALLAVAERLWNEVSLIDEYLAEQQDLTPEHREILLSWKRCIRDTFILDRYQRGAAILISPKDKKVYRAIGITSSFPEMFQRSHVPLILETTLLPFRDVIISDGLFRSQSVFLGAGAAKESADLYRDAKANNTIIEKL